MSDRMEYQVALQKDGIFNTYEIGIRIRRFR